MNQKKTGLAAMALVGLMAGLSGCDDSSSSSASPKYTPSEALAFREWCAGRQGKVAEISCNGTSKCAGVVLSGETGKRMASECKGHNTCSGLQCYDTLVAM